MTISLTPTRRWWLGSFAFVFALCTAWAIATPIFASPDEPAHVVRAVAAAHGQLLGKEFGPENVPPYPVPVDPKPWISGLAVDVPGVYQHWGNINCLVFGLNEKGTGDCVRLEGPDRDVRTLVTGGRHPPEYYLAVGSVSLVFEPGRAQVYAMRLLSALLAAALVASAVTTLVTFAPGRFTLLGVAVALTPMTYFLMGSVNPSGLEIASGIGLWAHGAALALGGLERLGSRLLHRFGIAATVLVLSRPGSMLWLVLIVGVLALVAGFASVRELARERLLRIWGGVVALALAFQFAWTVHADALDLRKSLVSVPLPDSTSTSEILRHIIGAQSTFLREIVGVFGWLDTRPPNATFLIWIVAAGFLVLFAVVAAPRRIVVALGALFVLCLVVPVAYEGSLAGSVGYFWQGRYLIPLAVGLPILAGLGIAGERAPARRAVVPIGIGLVFAHVLAFGQALRRYSVGEDGTIFFFTSARWEPPIPGLVLLVLVTLILAVGVIVMRKAPIDDEAPPAYAISSSTQRAT